MNRRNSARGCSSCGNGTTARQPTTRARSIRARQSSCGTVTVVDPDPPDNGDNGDNGGPTDPDPDPIPGPGNGDNGDVGDLPGGLTREQAIALAGAGALGAGYIFSRN